MRKPRRLSFGIHPRAAFRLWRNGFTIWVDGQHNYTAEQAERLAAWLLKAAEWIREKETER